MSQQPSEHTQKSGFETRAIHAGYEPDPTTGAVIPPIYATSTYKQDGVGGLRGGYEYSRSANPTRTALEGNIAALEEGERGFAFASGLAAEHTLLRALCRPGDHVVIPDDAYGGTYRLFAKVEEPWGLAHTAAPVSDVDAMRAAIRPGETKVVWVETPTNPLLNIGDIEALAGGRPRRRRAARRRQHLRLAVPPAAAHPRRRRRRALDHEVLRRALRRRRRRARRARPRRRRAGRLPPERHRRGGRPVRRLADAARPQDARACGWTGTATTPSRSSTSSPAHPAVAQVIYPGLEEHPGHAVAAGR